MVAPVANSWSKTSYLDKFQKVPCRIKPIPEEEKQPSAEIKPQPTSDKYKDLKPMPPVYIDKGKDHPVFDVIERRRIKPLPAQEVKDHDPRPMPPIKIEKDHCGTHPYPPIKIYPVCVMPPRSEMDPEKLKVLMQEAVDKYYPAVDVNNACDESVWESCC